MTGSSSRRSTSPTRSASQPRLSGPPGRRRRQRSGAGGGRHAHRGHVMPWEPSQYHDTHQEALQDLIERKREGQTIVTGDRNPHPRRWWTSWPPWRPACGRPDRARRPDQQDTSQVDAGQAAVDQEDVGRRCGHLVDPGRQEDGGQEATGSQEARQEGRQPVPPPALLAGTEAGGLLGPAGGVAGAVGVGPGPGQLARRRRSGTPHGSAGPRTSTRGSRGCRPRSGPGPTATCRRCAGSCRGGAWSATGGRWGGGWGNHTSPA